MELEIKSALVEYDNAKVDIYVNYLLTLKNETDKDNKLKNFWYKNITKDQFIAAFKTVIANGLHIDGDTITLGWKKKLVITYDYHAYMNKIKLSYPETVFDFGIVYENDEYEFIKESGVVNYTHKLKDPFNVENKIVGGYGIIKNDKGEFLETLNMNDIANMRNSAKTKLVWDAWFDRMVLKSIIKRICSIHFKDIVKAMDEADNEQIDPSMANLSSELQKQITEAKDNTELGKIYKDNIGSIVDRKAFIEILGKRRKELTK